MLSTLCNVRVIHVNRSVNMAAYGLARAAISMLDVHVWDFAPPQCIQAILASHLS